MCYELSGMSLISLTFHRIAAHISLPWTHTSILSFKLIKPYLFKIGGFSNYFCAFIIFMYICIYNLINTYVCANSLHSCLTLWDPVDCSLPCSSAHGILQARVLEWVTMLSSRESSQFRDQTLCLKSPALAGRFHSSQVVLVVKNPVAKAGSRRQRWGSGYLGRDDPLEQEMATNSVIFAWRIPWTEEPGGLQPIGPQRVRYHWSDLV